MQTTDSLAPLQLTKPSGQSVHIDAESVALLERLITALKAETPPLYYTPFLTVPMLVRMAIKHYANGQLAELAQAKVQASEG